MNKNGLNAYERVPHKYEDVSAFILQYIHEEGGCVRISHLLRDITGMGHDYKVSAIAILVSEGVLTLNWDKRTVSIT